MSLGRTDGRGEDMRPEWGEGLVGWSVGPITGDGPCWIYDRFDGVQVTRIGSLATHGWTPSSGWRLVPPEDRARVV